MEQTVESGFIILQIQHNPVWWWMINTEHFLGWVLYRVDDGSISRVLSSVIWVEVDGCGEEWHPQGDEEAWGDEKDLPANPDEQEGAEDLSPEPDQTKDDGGQILKEERERERKGFSYSSLCSQLLELLIVHRSACSMTCGIFFGLCYSGSLAKEYTNFKSICAVELGRRLFEKKYALHLTVHQCICSRAKYPKSLLFNIPYTMNHDNALVSETNESTSDIAYRWKFLRVAVQHTPRINIFPGQSQIILTWKIIRVLEV